jgi:succinyl-CoA synthetase beta subunit
MNLHEYQSKKLFAEFGVAVPRGIKATSQQEAIDAAKETGWLGLGGESPGSCWWPR